MKLVFNRHNLTAMESQFLSDPLKIEPDLDATVCPCYIHMLHTHFSGLARMRQPIR